MYINLNSINAKNGNFKFLVDPGANNSIIKATSLTLTTKFKKTELYALEGISPNSIINTIGCTTIPLIHNEYSFDVKFQIINSDSKIPYDGLIGNDIFRKEMAKFDYSMQTIHLNSVPDPIHFHFFDGNKINTFEEKVIKEKVKVKNHISNSFTCKARSETLIEVEILNPDIKEGIIPNCEIGDNLFLSKAITKVNEHNRAYATILNTSTTNRRIDKLAVKLEPIPKTSKIFASGNYKYDEKARIIKLKNELITRNPHVKMKSKTGRR